MVNIVCLASERKATYPNPNDSNPSTRNGANLGEAPVSVRGDDGGDELGDAEGNEQGRRRTFHEEEPMGTSDEDEGLGDDRNLQVDNHMEATIISGFNTRRALELDAERILEELGLQDDDHKDDGG